MTPSDAAKTEKRAVLVLEDGTVVRGVGFGSARKVSGEVVFNTGMVGYPESITDPSYAGQILIQTYPLIGNYGINPRDFESDGPKIEGYIIHELCNKPSHWTCKKTLEEWLTSSGVPGITNVDTRFLTQKIRTKGTMLGILHVCEARDEADLSSLLNEVKSVQDPNERQLAYEVATKTPKRYDANGNRTIILVDCGVKASTIHNLIARGVNVVMVPPVTTAKDVLDLKPDGILFSNGPGDPKVYGEVITTAKKVVDAGIPVMGICLGSQILALALGGTTYKLKFGHRGQNHPCIEVKGKRCYITSQNHGYAIDAESLVGTGLEVILLNANDRTVEGIRHTSLPVLGTQFHPETSPGPNDTNFLFDTFVAQVRKGGVNHA